MNQTAKHTRISKFLSLILRHEPQRVGLVLEEGGWVEVDELIARCNKAGMRITTDLLRQVVEENDKRRFSFNDDGTRIRANQGHSVKVALGFEAVVPPAVLYHGTAVRFLDSIMVQGLERRARHHVHLSESKEVARSVGARHGKPAILLVQAARMHADGHTFFVSDNGVWLTESVGTQYLSVL
jgi:putative RNA 2'-phosphotransferase